VLKELLEAHLLPKEKGDVKKRDRCIKHVIFRRKRKASSAFNHLPGFGASQPSWGSHRGSAGGCQGVEPAAQAALEEQRGRRGEQGDEKEKEIVPCPSLMPKNEKKL